MGGRGGRSHAATAGGGALGASWTQDARIKIKEFATKLGITIDIHSLQRGNTRPDTVMSALQDVREFYRKFPAAKGAVKEVVFYVRGGNAYAGMDTRGTLHLRQYGTMSIEKLKSQYNLDLSAKFHPQNTDYHAIIWHEIGHALESHIARKENGRASFGPIAVDVLERAAKKTLGLSPADSVSVDDIRGLAKTISGYAVSNKDTYGNYNWQVWETVAEAVGDYAQNGSKANKYSVAIAQEVLNRLK